jgi:hydroxymethylpyrimidine pyrophosphatase-like HAD family hydrolase
MGLIFASDLDNTLIHSRKKSRRGDVCVETRDGERMSFMTRASRELLGNLPASCRFVPVTTRSVEQYSRINLPIAPEYAIVCNGAVLLKGGEPDADWSRATRESLADCLERIPGYYEAALVSDGVFDVRLADGFFIFAKFNDRDVAATSLGGLVDSSLFDVIVSYNKIYVMPKGLRKGAAALRLKNLLGRDDRLICAGDSELDLSMLRAADVAIVPRRFPFDGENFSRADDEDFSEFVLRTVMSECSNKDDRK